MSEENKKPVLKNFTGGDNFFGQILKTGVGDEKFIRDIVEIFLDECSQTLSNLKEAIAINDINNVQLFAHKLKSSFILFDMIEAHQLAYELENIESDNFHQANPNLNRLNSVCADSFKSLRVKYLNKAQ